MGFSKSNFGYMGSLKQAQKGYVDKYQVYHFKPRSSITRLVGFSLATITYLSNVDTIPYSKRTHLAMPRKGEKMMGEYNFTKFKTKHEENILPPTDPTSVRVNSIAQNVIKALDSGLRDDKVWGGPNYASRWKDAWKGLWRLGKGLVCKKESIKIGESRATEYLKHVDWEVVVVDEPIVNAYCYPGGKIVMFTGRLKYLKSDAEIATIIGHEVAHVVARHNAEHIGKSIVGLILDVWPVFLENMFSRKMELEADYIGMLLMASAGYDPRVAVRVREKMEKFDDDDNDDDHHDHHHCRRSYLTMLRAKALSYKRTHPTNKKRVELLVEAQEEAMKLYRPGKALRTRKSFRV